MAGLMTKFVQINTKEEVDNLKYDSIKIGTFFKYRVGIPNDTDNTPGALIVLPFGGASTIQIAINQNRQIFLRTYVAGEIGWRGWKEF